MRKKGVKKKNPVQRADRYVVGFLLTKHCLYGGLADETLRKKVASGLINAIDVPVSMDGHNYANPMTLPQAKRYAKTFTAYKDAPVAIYELVPVQVTYGDE